MYHDLPVEPRVDRPLVSPVTIGRGSYLDALELALAEAVAGRGGAILVSGEVGVGKSRLLGEAEARAARMGMLIMRGNWGRTTGRGKYDDALASARTGLQIAEEIGHSQWMCASLVQLGSILCDILAYEQARPTLERAIPGRHERGRTVEIDVCDGTS